jgi:hypothetical protein
LGVIEKSRKRDCNSARHFFPLQSLFCIYYYSSKEKHNECDHSLSIDSELHLPEQRITQSINNLQEPLINQFISIPSFEPKKNSNEGNEMKRLSTLFTKNKQPNSSDKPEQSEKPTTSSEAQQAQVRIGKATVPY